MNRHISVSELARRVGLEPPRLYMSMRVERNKRMVAEWQEGMALADQAMGMAFYDSPAAVPHTTIAPATGEVVEKGTGRTTTLLLTAMASAYNGVPSVFIVGDEVVAELLGAKVAEWCDLVDLDDLPLEVLSRAEFNSRVRADTAAYRDKATFYDHEQPKWV